MKKNAPSPRKVRLQETRIRKRKKEAGGFLPSSGAACHLHALTTQAPSWHEPHIPLQCPDTPRHLLRTGKPPAGLPSARQAQPAHNSAPLLLPSPGLCLQEDRLREWEEVVIRHPCAAKGCRVGGDVVAAPRRVVLTPPSPSSAKSRAAAAAALARRAPESSGPLAWREEKRDGPCPAHPRRPHWADGGGQPAELGGDSQSSLPAHPMTELREEGRRMAVAVKPGWGWLAVRTRRQGQGHQRGK